jgi:hypothetical protein
MGNLIYGSLDLIPFNVIVVDHLFRIVHEEIMISIGFLVNSLHSVCSITPISSTPMHQLRNHVMIRMTINPIGAPSWGLSCPATPCPHICNPQTSRCTTRMRKLHRVYRIY